MSTATSASSGAIPSRAGSRHLGALFVAIAATLWATDTLFRYPLTQAKVDPTFLVFLEHTLICLVYAPFAVALRRREILAFDRKQWLSLFAIGGGASGIATILFTSSFRYVNPSVSILLQKLQPIFVVLLAMAFLGERPKRSFYPWAAAALVAGLAISFPDFHFGFVREIDPQSIGVLFALGAAFLWALALVLAKGALHAKDPLVVTFWRFVFGWVAVGALVLPELLRDHAPLLGALSNGEAFRAVLYIALMPGLLSMILYYYGVRKTPATTATFMELAFPVSAVLINTLFLRMPLQPVQGAAALLLLFAGTRITLANRNG